MDYVKLRPLYEAAKRIDSVGNRTFEEWCDRVSDYGLDDARSALEVWRGELEHSLATTFVEMQRSFKAEERQAKWFECLRLVSEIEKLEANNAANKM